MSSYSELIKNFERIRAYMREFYVYGFKSRDDYNKKSARSYDDERRRMESILGDHMSFLRTPEGKNVFISIDSRTSRHNPFYKAWKSKSFTDGDVTLHFIIFDILHSPEISYSIPELMRIIDEEYLSYFDSPMMFDESTLRKKLKEYCEEGILIAEKKGKRMLYRRAEDISLSEYNDLLDFYSEIAPCGVIGSFLLDKTKPHKNAFAFKHHYITGAMDSGILAALFTAMRQKRVVTVTNHSSRSDEPRKNRIIPLRIFISTQNGKQHLIAYHPDFNCFRSFRVDYLSNVKLEDVTPRFDELRAMLDKMQGNMWGVVPNRGRRGKVHTEQVSFTIKVAENEDYIVKRLYREKRNGTVEKLDDSTYRFTAEVHETSEMIPWIRTFICRIAQMNFSNRTEENRFKADLEEMYKMYGIKEDEL